MSCLLREKLREPPALRALVALDVELGIDLVYILLDAALGEKQLFRDLPVRQPLCHQADQRIFPLKSWALIQGYKMHSRYAFCPNNPRISGCT